MPVDEVKEGCFAWDVLREGEDNVLRISCETCSFFPSIEDSPLVMSKTIEILASNPGVTRIVFNQKRDYEYDDEQTSVLSEIAKVQSRLSKSDVPFVFGANARVSKSYVELKSILHNVLKYDPILAFVELRRLHRHEALRAEAASGDSAEFQKKYVGVIERFIKVLEGTKLIGMASAHLAGYKPGDRSAYREIFRAMTKPDFMFTKLMSSFPPDGEEIDSYTVDDTDVVIFRMPDTIKLLYHVTPPEFKLSEDKYELLDAARSIVSEHKPQRSEFVDPERLRQVFFNVGSDLIEELASFRNLKLRNSEVKELTRILVRHTIGFGLIEVLLQDEKVQDITINSPMGNIPIFLVHQDYDDCYTNIIPTPSEGESWASKLRLLSGRPLDEANPILDSELTIPNAKARVAVISPPLNPSGLAYALRRHRDKPWTLALFIKNKMMSPLAGGLLSFLIDGARTMLVAGTRSAGKTSLLGAVMTEIMRKYRLITIEDSVAGDSTILIRRNGRMEYTSIGSLIDNLIATYGKWYSLTEHEVTGNPENIEVFSMNREGKVTMSRVRSFIRHKTEKEIFLVRTRTGKEIKVTGDHSLFCIGNAREGSVIKPVKTTELKPGDFLATPRILPISNPPRAHINVLDHLECLEQVYFFGKPVEMMILENRALIKKICNELGVKRGKADFWLRRGLLPCKVLRELKGLGYELNNPEHVLFKHKNSKALPVLLPLTPEFLTFIGLWLGDGCYDTNSVIISSGEEEAKDVIKNVADSFGLNVRLHSDGFSSMINSSVLKLAMREVLQLKGDSYTKSIPKWVFAISKCQIAYVLKGLFSADGCVADKEIVMPLASLKLLKDVQSLLLHFGIIFRIGRIRKDKTYNASISSLEMWRKMVEIGFLQRKKTDKLSVLCKKVSTHSTSDVIPLALVEKRKIAESYRGFSKYDYITRENNVGRRKLLEIATYLPGLTNLRALAESDIFFDEISEIKSLGLVNDHVYDLSVPQFENFICENVLAHNTLELPVSALRDLGYNIQSMKVASAMTRGTTEVPADEGIRTTLRLGDSSLIVGEVRSSIRGDQEVIIVENGMTKRVPIKDVELLNIEECKVPSLDFELKTKLLPLSAFVKHPERKRLLEIKTRTGRKVTVTPDHSLFAATRDFRIAAVECKDLKVGCQLVIPTNIPVGYNDIEKLELMSILHGFRLKGFEAPLRHAISVLGYKKATQLCEIKSNDVYKFLRRGKHQKTNIPIDSFNKLSSSAKVSFNVDELSVTKGTGNDIPAVIPVNEDFCSFLGYFVSEGYYSVGKGGSVILTNSDPQILEDMTATCERLFKIKPKSREVHGAGRSYQLRISSITLVELLKWMGCGRTCTEKRIPPFVFGLSKRKIAAFLSALYEGDGSITVSNNSGNSIRYYTTSKKLAEDVAYILLSFGIVARIRNKIPKKGNVLWSVEFKSREMVEEFMNHIGFRFKGKCLLKRKWSHSTANIAYFDRDALKDNLPKYPRKYRHLFRFKRCTKPYLKKVVNDPECEASDRLKMFANGNFYLDEVMEVQEIMLDSPEPVYDLSVAPCQNFIGGFGGILLHNTEAKALYEAMRVGALANVVAGTIHGDSPYGVFDRVVNDLGVPKTSFKATDIIVVANPIRSADGLHKWRRVTQITEVGKFWENDPILEKGFRDLMKYDSMTDSLEPTSDLLNGESDVLKSIAGNVKDWSGSWDAIWDNILLRTKIKETLISYSALANDPEMLEAPFVIQSNDEFHRICDSVKEELGRLDSGRIFFEWNEWVKMRIKKAVREERHG